ncbi:ABC transporter ATP-binding protein [Entomospira entomophila]|nr:ABC transporter ATP-binding protein [Entomospira entomophilus]
MINLKADKLSFQVHQKILLSDITFHLTGPQLVGVIGANGSGKSTLIRLLAGLLKVHEGRLFYNNKDLLSLPPTHRSTIISLLAPQWELKPNLLVQDILTYYNHEHQDQWKYYSEKLHLSPLLDRSFPSLSQGEQARVLLARTLALQTPILLLDEPFANLDLEQEERLWQILKFEAKSRLVIIASHNLQLCSHHATQLILLRAGTINQIGKPQETFTQDNLNSTWDSQAYRIENKRERPSYIWLEYNATEEMCRLASNKVF